MQNIIQAAISPKTQKLPSLEHARLLLEILKHLVRIEYELQIIPEKTYIRIESLVIETTKMTNGWIKYLA